MLNHLLVLIVFMHNPDLWKERVYEDKYNQAIIQKIVTAKREAGQSGVIRKNDTSNTQKISWYAKGLKDPNAFTAACWSDFPKGTRFQITYRNSTIIVTCTDRGHFQEMGRFLDITSGAFESLAPLSTGVITAEVTQL